MIRATKKLLQLKADRLNEISNVNPGYWIWYTGGYIELRSNKTGRCIYSARTKGELLKVMDGLEQFKYTENGL